MLEKEFGTLFGKWIIRKENKPKNKSEDYEFKVTNCNTFNLKQWRNKQPHQSRSLKQANNEVGVYHKLSDMSMGQKPFDAFFIVNANSFLVLYFNKHKKFFMIPVKQLPDTDSISYEFCLKKFEPKTLTLDKVNKIIDFEL